MTNPTSYEYDIFLSHNHNDQDWTARLAERLEKEDWQGRKIRVFFSPWDILPGQSIPLKIERALSKSRKVGLIMSPDAIASAWVDLERLVTTHIAMSAREERLIPLLRRACQIPTLVQHLLYIDFTDDDQFEESYRRLLSVIKDEPTPRQAPKPASSPKSAGSHISLPSFIPRPPAVGFVARRNAEGRDIVEQLREELAPGRNQLVVLWGAGGVGKTTLAVEAAQGLSGVFGRRIVWASPELRADLTLATLLDEIATQLGRADLRPFAFEPKEEGVLALLAEAHALVILDNFETITPAEQTRCAEWLAKRARCPALITTRQRITGAHNISIHAMTPEEANEFVERWIKQEARSQPAFEGLERERIIETAGRNPLVLQWVLARIDLAGEPGEVLDELMQGEGDAAQRVFDSSFKLPQLGDDGRDALLALSLFVPDASRDALAEVAGFDADKRKLFNEAITRLSSLWLIETTQGNKRLKIDGLTRQLTKTHLSKDARADEFHKRFVAHLLRYAEAHAETTPEDFAALETEKDNILNAMDAAFDLKDWWSVIRLMGAMNLDGVNGLLTMHGYWDEAIRRGEQAIKAARNLRDEAAVARFAHNTGIIFQDRAELEEARRLYDESLEIAKRRGYQSGIASTLHQLAIIAQREGKFEEARRLYNESLEIAKGLEDRSSIAITLHQLATLAKAQGDLGETRRLFGESLEIKKQLGNQNGIAITLHALGVLAMDQGELAEARRLYEESLEITKRLDDKSNLALLFLNMGTLAEKEGHKTEAAQLLRDALSILDKLGSPYAEKARKSLKRLENESS